MSLIDKYTGLTKERFDTVMGRYRAFQQTCDDITKAPVKVFDNVTAKSLAELDLIREVSRDLQKKKEEDAKKAQAQAEEVKKVEVESVVVPEVEEEKKVE